MAKIPSAGDLRERLHFQKRTEVDDGFGNTTAGPFETQFTYRARLQPLRGGEAVIASRLAGEQPYIVTVRSSSQTRQVTAAWRLVDARDTSRIFKITAISDPDGTRQWLDVLATLGAPGGE